MHDAHEPGPGVQIVDLPLTVYGSRLSVYPLHLPVG